MLAARDVESLSMNEIARRLQDQVDGTACIFDVEKIASCVPLTVDRQFFAKKRTSNEAGHHFLQMLHRSKVIEWPNDNGGNPIRRPIREHQSIGPALGAGIGAHRVQWVLLVHCFFGCAPVNLGTRYVDKSLDFACSFDNGVGDGLSSKHVGLKEQQAVEDRAGDVGFGGEMDDDVRLLDQRIHQRRIAYIAVPKTPQRMLTLQHVLWEVFDGAGVSQNVENDDAVFGILFGEVIDQICTNESGAAGDENCTHQSPVDPARILYVNQGIARLPHPTNIRTLVGTSPNGVKSARPQADR